jgi:hypothetical protein
MARAVGVGGVFLKASDPKALSAWYAKHLGIAVQDGGTLAFDGPESLGMTVFCAFFRDHQVLRRRTAASDGQSAWMTWMACWRSSRRLE